MSPVAIGMILGSPAAADGDGGWLVEFENARLDIRHRMRPIAKRQILASGAAAVGDAFGDLFEVVAKSRLKRRNGLHDSRKPNRGGS